MTATALARSQADMWAQRVAEAEARLSRTNDPRALCAAIAAHEQHEADWQANRHTDDDAKRQALAQRQAAQQETAARAAGLRETEQWAEDRREAERWAAAVAQQEAVQQQAAQQKAVAVAAGIRAAGAAGRRAAHATSEAARIDYCETLHNGAWRGWGGLSPSERAETRARTTSSHWATDVDDTDGWTEHVVAAHLDLIPASELHLLPRMGPYNGHYGFGDYGDARE